MQIRRNFEIRHSALVDEQFLRQVSSLFSVEYANQKFEIECSDGSERTMDTVDELVGYSNIDRRKIKDMTLRANSGIYDRIYIHMYKLYIFENIRVNIESDDSDKIDRIELKLKEFFEEARFSFFHEFMRWIKPSNISIAFTVIIFIPSLIISIVKGGSTNSSKVDTFSLLVISISIFAILEWISVSLYPKVFFNIGKQKDKLQTIYQVRNVLFVVIILGVVVGVLGNYASGLILPRN